MTRVDFYVIPSADPDARLTIACRLAEKAWRQGMRIFVLCSDEAQRDALDARLWNFRGETFIHTMRWRKTPTHRSCSLSASRRKATGTC